MISKKNTHKTPEIPSNIRFTKIGKFVMITISLIWVASEIILLFGLKDNAGVWMRVAQIIVSAIPFAFLNHFIKEIMIQAMKNLKLISTDNEYISEKETNSSAFIFVIAVIFLIGGVVRGAIDTFEGGNPPTTTEVIKSTTSQFKETTIVPTKSPITKYDFSVSPEQYDIYFKDIDDRKVLFDVLENSLRSIFKKNVILDTELNETLYGEYEEETDILQIFLDDCLENTEMKGKQILKTINGIIIDNLLKMDEEYQIPENRKEIADAYLIKANNEENSSCLIDYENAVKYLWGSLYVSVSWNEYSPEIVDSLIDAYNNITKHNPKQESKVANIQAALKVIKARFEQEPVEPLEYK